MTQRNLNCQLAVPKAYTQSYTQNGTPFVCCLWLYQWLRSGVLCTLDCLISHIAFVCKCVCLRATVLARPFMPLFIVRTDTATARQTDGQRQSDRATESGPCCFHCFTAHLSYRFRFFCFDFRRIIKYTIVLEICQ